MNFQIRTELTVLPADPVPLGISAHSHLVINSSGKRRYKKNYGPIGFTIKETIGIGVINPRGISKATKSTVIGK